MKKIFILIFISLFLMPLFVFAEEETDELSETEELHLEGDYDEYYSDYDWDELADEKGKFRIKDRKVEIGFLHLNAGFSNNFLTTKMIFPKDGKMILDLEELRKGFRINIDAGLTPFYFTYNNNNLWGFGLTFAQIDMQGIFNLSGNMLSLSEVMNDKSDVSGAVFGTFQVPVFFHVDKFKVRVKPSFFYPVAYFKPNVSYSLNTDTGLLLDINYDAKIFTPISLAENADFKLSSKVGLDFHLGAEYPLADVLGLTDMYSFLDFKVGVDIINLPMIRAQMKDYMRFSGQIGESESFDIFDYDWDNLVKSDDVEYGEDLVKILRPFKMLLWADWKPFEKVPVNFVPALGFALNPLYNKPASMEGGIKARFDLANLFITTFGIGYHDRMWKNSFDMALNLRFFELSLGVDMRSPSFGKSWTGGGFGANFGLKFGG